VRSMIAGLERAFCS